MEKEFAPKRLDTKALASAEASLEGAAELSSFQRLSADLRPESLGGAVNWRVSAEMRTNAQGLDDIWLHLALQTHLPLVCQRCLGPVEVPLSLDRWFRFVANEEVAQAQDDEVEEDLLVFSREFDLAELIEDELLMETPLVPRHDVCPVPVKLEAVDADFDLVTETKANPFAALAGFQISKGK